MRINFGSSLISTRNRQIITYWFLIFIVQNLKLHFQWIFVWWTGKCRCGPASIFNFNWTMKTFKVAISETCLYWSFYCTNCIVLNLIWFCFWIHFWFPAKFKFASANKSYVHRHSECSTANEDNKISVFCVFTW